MWTKVAFVFLLLHVFCVSRTFAQSEAPKGGGTVCPAGTSVQAAEAEGCRFIGSETGYDICANIGTENLSQCYSVNHVTTGQPDSHQVYMGVIMPTQNCERANASRPANWQYDCSTWCKSFLYYNKTAVSTPQLPAICTKYLPQQQPPPTRECQAAVPPAGAAGPYPEQTITNMIELWKRRIDHYWFQEFGRGQYVPAMLVLSHNPDDDLYLDVPNRRIVYNPAIVNAIIGQARGVFGLVIALAHEEGHWVQLLIGRRLRPQIRQELDADTLSGDWLRWALQQGYVHQCDLAVALMGTFQAQDPPGLHVAAFDPQAHGTAQQRVAAVMKGFNEKSPDLSGSNPFTPPNPFHSPLIPNTN